MKRLLFLRHAKTEQINKDTSGDRDRVLTERGRIDAPRVGHIIDVKGYLPDLILCSPSVRTRQTLDLAQAEFGRSIQTTFVNELYDASTEDIFDLVRSLHSSIKKPLIVGHNPGFAECAAMLVRPPHDQDEQKRVSALKEKFPTSALAVLDFEIENWPELRPGSGRLTDFICPKDLG